MVDVGEGSQRSDVAGPAGRVRQRVGREVPEMVTAPAQSAGRKVATSEFGKQAAGSRSVLP